MPDIAAFFTGNLKMPTYGPDLDVPFNLVRAVRHACVDPAVMAARSHDTGDP